MKVNINWPQTFSTRFHLPPSQKFPTKRTLEQELEDWDLRLQSDEVTSLWWIYNADPAWLMGSVGGFCAVSQVLCLEAVYKSSRPACQVSQAPNARWLRAEWRATKKDANVSAETSLRRIGLYKNLGLPAASYDLVTKTLQVIDSKCLFHLPGLFAHDFSANLTPVRRVTFRVCRGNKLFGTWFIPLALKAKKNIPLFRFINNIVQFIPGWSVFGTATN